MTGSGQAKKVHEGKVVAPARGPASPLDALGALNGMVEAVRECFLVHEQESSKRARLDTYENVEVARIKAAEAVLSRYFEQAFAERRGVIDDLFTRLDAAVADGDAARANDTLRGIVDVARTSPLADLGDLGQIRRALDDPDQVWEL